MSNVVSIGKYCVIADDVIIGKNVKIGSHVTIEEDVVIGSNVKLGNNVILKAGTRLGSNVDFADNCVTTGVCWVGNNTVFRTGAVLSKSVIVEDCVFYGPGVITNHTKHVNHFRPNMREEQLLTIIGYGSIIGTQTSVVAGVKIAPLVIIGGGSVIVKDIKEVGVYVGNPAKKIMDLPKEYYLETPQNAGSMYFNKEVLNHFYKYIPNLKI